MIDKSNYKELINDMIDIRKELTIVYGVVDIKKNIEDFYRIENIECIDIIIGNLPEETIKECLIDYLIEVGSEFSEEGEYQFDAVFKYITSDDYSSEYAYIDYIKFNFIQTFKQREREEKLFKLLDNDLDIFS